MLRPKYITTAAVLALAVAAACTNQAPSPQLTNIPTPMLEATVEQDYVRVTKRTSGDGYTPKVDFEFRVNGIPYYYVEFLQSGVKGALVVPPQYRFVVLNVEKGTNDSVPFKATSGCDAVVKSFWTTPQSLTKAEEDPTEAARINRFLKRLYAAVGINPTDCTIKQQ